MRQTYIWYGRRQARLTRRIAQINATQAAANAAAQAASKAGSWTDIGFGVAGGVAHLLNGAIQAAAEIAKGEINAKKEKLNAEQTARIVYLNDNISAANSEALVKNLLLGMSTLSLESTEASILLAQDMGRLQALLDEQAYLEARWAEADVELVTRYFADPSHRIIQNRDVLAAGDAFDQAQFWVFVLARALDYKWNEKVDADGYSANTLFKLRNAKELADMAVALFDYDEIRNLGQRHGNQFAKFSLREDFLGYRRFADDGFTRLYYPDPVTGQSVDALTAFRSYLKQVAPHVVPRWVDNQVAVRLEFSTAKRNRENTFFSTTRWNEKINWIAVSINAQSSLSSLATWLEQSGTAFIRDQWRGVVLDEQRPDLVAGEMTSYPVRYWTIAEDGRSFAPKDRFGIGVNARISADPDEPDESWQKREFHELSPAVSRWTLEIPISDDQGTLLDLDRVSDVEIWFSNYYLAPRLSY